MSLDSLLQCLEHWLADCHYGRGAYCLLHPEDKVSRIGSGRAVIHTGHAGGTLAQDFRVFALHEQLDLSDSPTLVIVDVTTFQQAVATEVTL
jgi:hypothetical protein